MQELVRSVARDAAPSAAFGRHQRRPREQDLVGRLVTVGVVEQPEVVDVDERDADAERPRPRAASMSSASAATTAPWFRSSVSASRRVASSSCRCWRAGAPGRRGRWRTARRPAGRAAARVTIMMSRRVASIPASSGAASRQSAITARGSPSASLIGRNSRSTSASMTRRRHIGRLRRPRAGWRWAAGQGVGHDGGQRGACTGHGRVAAGDQPPVACRGRRARTMPSPRPAAQQRAQLGGPCRAGAAIDEVGRLQVAVDEQLDQRGVARHHRLERHAG